MRKISKAVDQIAREYLEETDPIMRAAFIQKRLFSYSETLDAWANQIADIMVRRAAAADFDVWKDTGKKLSKATLDILKSEDRGATYQRLKAEQVHLIKSLPLDASKKVVEWTQKGLADGERWEVIAERISDELGGVTESRARCIARTETARSRSNFTQARAQAIGCTHYIWHAVGDGAVRHDHQLLNGTVQAWDSPPVADRRANRRAHPGTIYNCFVGETVVSIPDDLVGVIKSPFNGRVIDICTADAVITVTPNHPMLTNRGWVKAGELNKGDYLLKAFGNTVSAIESNKDGNHICIQDLFDSLGGEHKTLSSVLFDFYGDIPDGDVDYAVFTKGSLRANRKTKRLKSLENFSLSNSSAVMTGVFFHRLKVGISCFFRKAPSLFKRKASHSEKASFASAPDSDVVLFKAVANWISGDTHIFGDGQNGLSSCVSADYLGRIKFEPVMGGVALSFGCVDTKRAQSKTETVGRHANLTGSKSDGCPIFYEGFCIKNLFSRDFVGHVYTLETKKGWYEVTDCNYIVKNCRCFAEPLLPDLDK